MTQEDMFRILAKHKPSISWKRVATDAMESTDGYRVLKEPVHPSGWRYMAFHRAAYKQARCIGRFDSFELAKLGCDAHRLSANRADAARGGAEEAAPVEAGDAHKDSGSVG